MELKNEWTRLPQNTEKTAYLVFEQKPVNVKYTASMTTQIQQLACDSRQKKKPPAILEGSMMVKWAGPAMQASPKSFIPPAKRWATSTMEMKQLYFLWNLNYSHPFLILYVTKNK
jgi:hypothetical protein